ncbi:SDR family NAD(P)-dependent oxidoreductase [Limosilactobacillus sp.]|jgi:3-oxoacyl-[acyl-carrier protein] reductase|uniref:SDR family NAD(P)-dependent oxidoreductase n=1 Tax=Limosilactobacillus sp. TaxID=2773925 RepID=UPI0025BD5B3F|nr:SDR family oxidoreductase [Limosilactobacillus sp.]MCH3922809.1 SDR family oxidoreductase [Limosilactobacillus sp.]MCH3927492.1 SDR family oxidoreductase [Limosilactobacillus sp.]
MADEKVALITGASSGIGYGITEVFAANGVNVAMVALGAETLNEKTQEIRDQYHVEALPIVANIANEDEVNHAVQETIEKFGHLDYAVNDAGISGTFKAFHELTSADFDKTMGVDLRGTFLSMSAEIKQFVKQGYGSVVNITALGTEVAAPSMSLYIAAKAGIVGFTHAVAMDYADKGIRVNAVSPGAVRTNMTKAVLDDTSEGSFGQLLLNGIPNKRAADPKEIGEAVYFVASEKASYMTGQNVCVDGGASTGNN